MTLGCIVLSTIVLSTIVLSAIALPSIAIAHPVSPVGIDGLDKLPPEERIQKLEAIIALQQEIIEELQQGESEALTYQAFAGFDGSGQGNSTTPATWKVGLVKGTSILSTIFTVLGPIQQLITNTYKAVKRKGPLGPGEFRYGSRLSYETIQ